MSNPIAQAAASRAASKGLNFSQLSSVIAFIGEHPEVLQLIQLAASLKGNPQLVPQVQARADKLLLTCLVAADGVAGYAAQSLQAAGQQPSGLLADVQADLDALLAKYKPAAPAQ